MNRRNRPETIPDRNLSRGKKVLAVPSSRRERGGVFKLYSLNKRGYHAGDAMCSTCGCSSEQDDKEHTGSEEEA